MPTGDLCLSSDTFMCRTEGHAVFLNLETDQYYCVDGEKLDQGLSAADLSDPLIGDLVRAGLLTQGEGRLLSPTRQEVPAIDCSDFALDRTISIRARHGRAFAVSVTGTLLRLRLGSLRRAVMHALRTRELLPAVPAEDIRDLVEIFTRLRPIAFTGVNHCLFDSFAMASFLASFGHPTRITFAVRLKPFGAHCWLQNEGFILNDTVDHVAGFTPIMVV